MSSKDLLEGGRVPPALSREARDGALPYLITKSKHNTRRETQSLPLQLRIDTLGSCSECVRNSCCQSTTGARQVDSMCVAKVGRGDHKRYRLPKRIFLVPQIHAFAQIFNRSKSCK